MASIVKSRPQSMDPMTGVGDSTQNAAINMYSLPSKERTWSITHTKAFFGPFR